MHTACTRTPTPMRAPLSKPSHGSQLLPVLKHKAREAKCAQATSEGGDADWELFEMEKP